MSGRKPRWCEAFCCLSCDLHMVVSAREGQVVGRATCPVCRRRLHPVQPAKVLAVAHNVDQAAERDHHTRHM